MMKAIILSAGQGKRLLPLTEEQPKCLLPVDGDSPALELQLRALAHCGIHEARVMVGFGASRVEAFLAAHPVRGLHVTTRYNPFFGTTDNLVTCWLATLGESDDFLLLNGDTLFEPALLSRLLEAAPSPIRMAVDHKDGYDADDMKVTLHADGRLLAVGKTLPPEQVQGEAIGMILFRDGGGRSFASALEASVRSGERQRAWYLSAVDDLARRGLVRTVSVHGLWWAEVDSRRDLAAVRVALEQAARGTSSARRIAAREGLDPA